MTLQLGDIAPDFSQDSSEGIISFHEWAGDKWVVLFSHPADYTPVCTTELGMVSKLKSEFEKRNVKVLALSVDGVSSHKGWINDINETQLDFHYLTSPAEIEKKLNIIGSDNYQPIKYSRIFFDISDFTEIQNKISNLENIDEKKIQKK